MHVVIKMDIHRLVASNALPPPLHTRAWMCNNEQAPFVCCVVCRYVAANQEMFTVEYDAAPQEYHRRMM